MLKKLKGFIHGCLVSPPGLVSTMFLFVTIIVLVLFFLAVHYNEYDILKHIGISVLIFFSLLIPGYAFFSIKCFGKVEVIEKFCLSFGISVALYALIALFSVQFGHDYMHQINLFFLLFLNIGGLFYIFKKQDINKEKEKKLVFLLSVIFLSFVIFLQLFVSLPFKMPEKLQDGPYVFKTQKNLHVKIQALTGDLPADNFIPFVFSQYLLRGISFEKNRPMLPGQEVSNRTVLMGLDAVYFLSIFDMPLKMKNNILDKFKYVGTEWPNVGKFGNDNEAFSIFLDMGIILNSLFLFSVFMLISKIFGNNKAIGSIFLLLLFPFVINQIIFTWPKFLVAYFLIASIYLIITRKNLFLISLFLALSYHSHPMAIVYVGFIILYFFIKNYIYNEKKNALKNTIILILVTSLLVSPWIIWTNFIVKITSDLVTQNAITSDYGVYSLIKVRLDNLYLLFFPWQMSGATDFTNRIFSEMLFTFAGAVGVYFIVSYFYIIKYVKKYFCEILLLFIGPISLLIMPWGRILGNFSVIFSQPAIPLFFAFSVVLFSRHKKTSFLLIMMQICLSMYALWFGMYKFLLQKTQFDIPDGIFILSIVIQLSFSFGGLYFLLARDKEFEEVIKTI